MQTHNDKAERGVIACCWQSTGAHARTRRKLGAQDFYLESSRAMWRAMCTLREDGREVDAISMADELERVGLLEVCGGPGAVATYVNDYPSVAAVDTYTEIVLDHARRRRLHTAAREATGRLQTGDEVGEVVAGLSEAVREFRAPRTKSVAELAYSYIEKTLNGGGGLSLEETAPWYHALAGELHKSTYLVLGGMSGHGKSTCASIIVTSAKRAADAVREKERAKAKANGVDNPDLSNTVRCLWYSCEMPEEFQMFRLMSAMYRIPEAWFLDARLVPVEKQDAFFAAASKVVEMEEWCTIQRMGPLDARKIALELEAECIEHPDAHVICVVDYIQRCEAGERTERENIRTSSRILADASLSTGATVFALSQFTESDKRQHPIPLPSARQLRGAKDIEHDAVQVLIYHRPWEGPNCMLAMPKSRYPLRKPGVIHLVGSDRIVALKDADGSCGNIGSHLPTVRVGHKRYS